MKVGIGYANKKDARYSGREIANRALQQGAISNPTFSIAFCSSNVDAEKLLAGIQEVIGEKVPVVGGSAIGIITNHDICYEGYPAGMVIIEDKDIHIQVGVAEELDKDAVETGRKLASFFDCEKDDKLLLFYDSVKQPPGEESPPILNSSKPLLTGFETHMNSNIPIIGGGTIGDFQFGPSVQFVGNKIKSQCATALLLRGDFSMDWRIMHGCSPKDGLYHTVTRVEGPALYELDGRPIVEMIDEMYGNEDWQNQVPVKRLTIGINHGDKYWTEYSEDQFINRLIVGVLPDKSGIIMFEPDLEVGDEVLFMLRNTCTMFDSAKLNTKNFIEDLKLQGKQPQWGFYIDCAGRTAHFSESMQEEATEVQKLFNEHGIPFFGFYSGVEIAPYLNKNCGLDWTGVLTVFSK